jgi:hypothetical protein
MVKLLRHRQPKGADTAKPHLSPPRHIPTLPCVTNAPSESGGAELYER